MSASHALGSGIGPAIGSTGGLDLRLREPLSPACRRLLTGGMLGAHLLAGWALLQAPAVREMVGERVGEIAPIQVELIAPAPQVPTVTPRPQLPPPPPPPQLRRPQPAPPPAPVIAATPPSKPTPAPVFTAPSPPPEAPPLPAPTAPPAPPAPPTPPQPAPAPPAPPAPAAAPAAPAAPTPAPAAPRKVELTDTDWIRPPAYAYPRAAQRLREEGSVVVRIFFDAQGVPRQVELARSSGSPRLDQEGLDKARQSRARPRQDHGVPIEFVATSEAEFKF